MAYAIYLKILVTGFFVYISIDAFTKRNKLLIESRNQKFSERVLSSLAKRETRRGVFFGIVALASLASIFVKTIVD